jgi:hypothetical protein
LWFQQKHSRGGSQRPDASAVPAWMKEGYQVVREIVQAVIQCSDPQQYSNCRSHPNKEKMDTLQFRLSLAQGLVEERGSGVCHPVQFSRRLNDAREDISWSLFPPRGRRQDLTEDAWCAQKRARGKNLSIGIVNEAALCLEGCFKAYHTLLNF